MYSNSSSTRWQQFRLAWYRCNHILRLLHARTDLQQLLVWAKRKGILRKVGSAYRYQLSETEMELANLQMRYPQASQWASVLYWINGMVSPKVTYTKGYAAKYRYQ